MQTEFEFINHIRAQAECKNFRSPDLVLDIGDDAAILGERGGRETLITADLLVEEVDFKLEYAVPQWLGHKSLAVSLSDVAAMGGAPCYSLLTLGIPKTNPQYRSPNPQLFWEEFFAGYFALAGEHSIALIGGDISSTPDRLTMDSIVIGRCQAGKAVRRSGARVGDGVYLTGAIGASAAGLRLLLEGARVNETEESLLQRALRAHLRPEPRVGFGRRIGESCLAHAMIDLSDGLAQDLAHICQESGVAAIIDFDAAPVAPEVGLITDDLETAFDFALGGGEDFELLLTAKTSDEEKLLEVASGCGVKLTRIGEIVSAGQGREHQVLLRRRGAVTPLPIRGFDHFLV